MAADLRINVGLARNPKLRKLVRQLGPGAAWSLVCLWAFAAEQRTDGDLAGLDDTDIELAADWTGAAGDFVQALVALRWLDGEPGARCLHDWSEHQPWVAGAADRADSARWAAMCKRYGRNGAAARMPDYAARMRPADDPHAARVRPADDPHAEREREQCAARAPSPSPSPSQDYPARLDILEGGADCPTADEVPIASLRDPTPPGAAALATPVLSTYRGEACKAMRRGGIVQTNPSHPDLLAAEAEGVPPDVWEPTARECVDRGKANFAYVVATARSRHQAGASPLAAEHPRRESLVERVRRQAAACDHEDELQLAPPPAIDGEFRRVG